MNPGKEERLREHALTILQACIRAADPEIAVRNQFKLENRTFRVADDFSLDLGRFDRVFVLGAGKASAPMAKALEDILGDVILNGLICVKYGHDLPLDRITVAQAGHPVPDSQGLEAARALMEFASQAGSKDLIISCISGGGSALLPAPPPGITLEEEQELTRCLLAVGADIHEINAVRKHLSLIKGGQLMKLAFPAFVINLMLSDVLGDDPGTIASGPFAPDRSTFGEVMGILENYELVKKTAPSIIHRIMQGIAGEIQETPKPGDGIFGRVKNVVIGSNIQSLRAGKLEAERIGYDALILSSTIQGHTTEAALLHAAVAREIRSSQNPAQPPACILSGGETTVVVRGRGKGGRNQEFCLSLVKAASEIPGSLFLSAGTDGNDGPTDAAGALVDSLTLQRASALGLNPDEFLKNNDSYNFFQRLGDLIVTGPTRTNVMDVRLILVS
ncbi:MAG: glycerate kinase [Desulfomonile tiedjei]|uniref:Glycerate kinase n=1 Tax=Desulfomonile tiedjei TaxID=2358 RepID=A0A9D6Z1V7_9BACT|nr:glycerate kinase [Desulfomonile tiedjei]